MSAPATDPQDAVGLCLDGAISPPVAVARLLLGGADARRIADMVRARRRDSERWRALHGLVSQRGGDIDRLSVEVRQTASNHAALAADPAAGFAPLAAFFDRAAAYSPEAGVALYSLGDPAILAEATAEIAAWLTAGGWLKPGADVLDFGCGAGRVSAALAPLAASVLGIDVSEGMIREARRRCEAHPNVTFAVTDGLSLGPARRLGFDLALAVDSMPYLMQAPAAAVQAVLTSIAAALRPGGALAVLNLSYGRGLAEDRADAAEWAARHGWTLAIEGDRPFAIWDAAAFVFRRG